MANHASNEPRGRHRLGRVLLGVTVAVGLTGFIVMNGSAVDTVADGLAQIALRPALGGVFFSLAAVANRGLLNRAAHEAMGLSTTPRQMIRTAAVGFTANKVVKSGGLSGLAVLVKSGRRRGFDTPRIVAACLVMSIATFVALGVLLATTLILLARAGELTGWWTAAGTGFLVYSAASTLLGFAAWRSRRTARWIYRVGHRTRARLSRQPLADADDTVVDAVYDAIAGATTGGAALRRLFAHAVMSKALGALMLMSAATAVGIPISVRTALVVYAAALGASLVTIVPGGVGVVEASTTALLIAAGAAPAVALLAVALYRIFDVWLPVAVGLAFGRSELRSVEPTEALEPHPIPAISYASA